MAPEPEREPTAADLMAAIDAAGDPADAQHLRRFFKTGPEEYGEGDVFVGVRVPATRAIVKRFEWMPLPEALTVLRSPVHEHRLAALLLMVRRFAVAGSARQRDDALRRELHDAYLVAVREGCVNNWDLVDSSAEYLVGEHLRDGDGDVDAVLEPLITSPVLWERRVAMLATFAWIKAGEAGPALRVAERLLGDSEDLMHKAVGWMLREVGKRVDRALLLGFLDVHAARMPRTTLSYATEHLPPEDRARYRAMR
jgi:hypothetical protein